MSISGDQYVLPVYPIQSEAKLKNSLYEKETETFVKSIVVKPSDFDRTYDSLVKEYLKVGGQQVINDRKAYLKIKK
jgi:putative aldouronate transport system substrate-binding protein